MTDDITYILTHVISAYEIAHAKTLPPAEQSPYLRRRIVKAQAVGYSTPGPVYQTGGGKITLFDLPAWTNQRTYSINHIVRLALLPPSRQLKLL